MSSGTSKRIKRKMSVLTAIGKPKSGSMPMSFSSSSFNNTQRFNNKQLTRQQYEKDIKLQQKDLIRARDNAEFLKPMIEGFNYIQPEIP